MCVFLLLLSRIGLEEKGSPAVELGGVILDGFHCTLSDYSINRIWKQVFNC